MKGMLRYCLPAICFLNLADAAFSQDVQGASPTSAPITAVELRRQVTGTDPLGFSCSDFRLWRSKIRLSINWTWWGKTYDQETAVRCNDSYGTVDLSWEDRRLINRGEHEIRVWDGSWFIGSDQRIEKKIVITADDVQEIAKKGMKFFDLNHGYLLVLRRE